MKKKILIFTLILALMVTTLCGCSWKNIFFGEDSSSAGTAQTSNSGVHNSIDFNVATNQKIADVELANSTDLSEYTDLKKVLKRIRKSVVEVYATTSSGSSAGSGVVIGTSDINNGSATNSASDSSISSSSTSGSQETSASSTSASEVKSYIVTCHHVIESASKVTIKTIDGSEYEAYFIGSDPDSDICVMSVNVKLDPVECYSDTSLLEVGESVVAIGNPLGTLGGTVTSGIISATQREIKVEGTTMELLQTDASINSGNSGGGLFTSTGFFIGMVNAKFQSSYTSVEGLGFAIPSNRVLEISKQLVTTSTTITPGYIPGKYQLGATVGDEFANRWGSQVYVVITAIDSLGSIGKSTLAVGDKVISTSYKGTTYTATKASELVAYLNSINFEIGDIITFNVLRNETSVSVPVTIVQYIYGNN